MPALKKRTGKRIATIVPTEEPTPTVETVAAPAKPRAPYLRVTLAKSGIGYKYDQKQTLAALGLRKLNAVVELPDNPSVRGMLGKVEHLVVVEEIG